MRGTWRNGGRRAAVLAGVLLIAGACVIALGAVAIDDPFSVAGPDSGTDASASAGNDGTGGEDTTPTDEETSASPRSGPATPDTEPPEDRADSGTGVNFVPGVRDFSIATETFDESSPDVVDGYVTPGEHRLLRFDMIIYNTGTADAELGRPEARPDLFEHSDSHGHAHMKGFNKYTLFDESGEEMDAGKKQTFCLRDSSRMPNRSNASSSPQFDCDYQGISAGWADVYDSSLPGQYLVIDGLPDGEYTLQATTNAEGMIDETCTHDNTVRVDLRIERGTVTVIDTAERTSTPVEHRLASDAHTPC